MSKQKPIAVKVEEYLLESGFNEGEPQSFRKLYEHVEFGKKISQRLLNKFIRCNIYFPDDNKIKDPEDGLGLQLQAMIFNGKLQAKCPDGIVYPLKRVPSSRNLSKEMLT